MPLLQTSFAISIVQEKKLAEKFMKMIKKEKLILNDPIAKHMVAQTGKHILSFFPFSAFDYSFHIIDDDAFNAFAAPGANIFIYRGTIVSLDSIDELAGIISHEIAHAQSRHVSESIDRNKFINISSLAGMLAGALIGGNVGTDAGNAMIGGSMALGRTAMLSFTRKNETEADEKGILFLKQSCFSEKGLLTGLMKIRAADYLGVEKIPDYIKTHPGIGTRIAHVENILSKSSFSGKKAKCKDFQFDMIKYRLVGLHGDVDATLNQLITKLEDDPLNGSFHYGLGIIYRRMFKYDKAFFHFKKALAIKTSNPIVLLEIGKTYLAQNKPQKALNFLNGLDKNIATKLPARFFQAKAYFKLKKFNKAKKGFLFVIKRDSSLYPQAYYDIANILSLERKKGLSHYYLGLYNFETRNKKAAKRHFLFAMKTLKDKKKIEKAKKLLDEIR